MFLPAIYENGRSTVDSQDKVKLFDIMAAPQQIFNKLHKFYIEYHSTFLVPLQLYPGFDLIPAFVVY